MAYRKRLSILLLVLMICTAGCQDLGRQAQKKPQQLAPEVSKYKEEPTLSLYRTKTGAIENLKLEEYLKGVVAAEIGPKFPMEALKAQAIVARSMTLALLEYENGTREKHHTDVSDSHTEFQAYDEKAITDRIAQAVDETRGQILTHNGKFTYAMFHSASQGKTASIEEGLPGLKDKASYLMPVKTNGLKNAPAKYKNWTVKVPRAKIQAIMGSKAGSLNDIGISKRGPSGRALIIKAGNTSIPAVELREAVGFDKLYSTQLHSIKAQGDYIVFKGSGWGHGVGMEQWGAYTLAKEGRKAMDIVYHYFPGMRLVKLYK